MPGLEVQGKGMGVAEMRLCFIVEGVYRHEGMPLRVAEQLRFPSFGHIPDAPAVVAGSILRIAGRAAVVRRVSA